MIIISYNNFRKGIVVAKSDMPRAAVQEPAGLMYSGAQMSDTMSGLKSRAHYITC